MDGFHRSRAELGKLLRRANPLADLMADPVSAHDRRGAPFTFDPASLLQLLRDIKTREGERLFAPSFDHSIKDPVPGDVEIPAAARVVLIEGLYLHLDHDVWRDVYDLFDINVWVHVEKDVALNRLVNRHVQSGISSDQAAATARAHGNDLKNAETILASRLKNDFHI